MRVISVDQRIALDLDKVTFLRWVEFGDDEWRLDVFFGDFEEPAPLGFTGKKAMFVWTSYHRAGEWQ